MTRLVLFVDGPWDKERRRVRTPLPDALPTKVGGSYSLERGQLGLVYKFRSDRQEATTG